MDIKNFVAFANFLSNNQLHTLHPSFDKLIKCMMAYNAMCMCGGQSNFDKMNKQSECNRIYRESIGIVIKLRPHFFSVCKDNYIGFYVDNSHLIKTIHR